MKWIALLTLMFITAAFFAACGGAVENKPVANASDGNGNAAAKPVAAAPTHGALMAAELKAWEAWKVKDEKFFQEMLTDNTIGITEKGRVDKAAIIKSITDPTCEVKSYSLSEDKMTAFGSDVVLLTYKATQDAKCGSNALPGTVWAATVLVRSDNKWKAAYHNEVPIIDPKAAPTKLADKKEDPKTQARITTSDGNPLDEDGKPLPKDADKKQGKPTISDANTAAMLAVEKAVWEAWKDHDGKKIDELLAKDVSFINIFGTFFPNKADAMKDWTSPGCEVKSVSVTDAVGTMLSPTVGILTFKGGADGTCFGQKVGPIWGSSIYVKDGDAWKWAFGMNLSAG